MDTKQPVWGSKRSNLVELRADIGLSSGRPSRNRLKIHRKLFLLRAVTDSLSCGGEDHSDRDEAVVKSERISVIVKDRLTKFQGIISSSPPVVFVVTLCHSLFRFQSFSLKLKNQYGNVAARCLFGIFSFSYQWSYKFFKGRWLPDSLCLVLSTDEAVAKTAAVGCL